MHIEPGNGVTSRVKTGAINIDIDDFASHELNDFCCSCEYRSNHPRQLQFSVRVSDRNDHDHTGAGLRFNAERIASWRLGRVLINLCRCDIASFLLQLKQSSRP
jgi:hypothetical protein